MNDIQFLTIDSESHLIETLKRGRISPHGWGKGTALSRPVATLWHEIQSGKCRLVTIEDMLVRLVTTATLFIYHPLSRTMWVKLIEAERKAPSGLPKPFVTVRGFSKKVAQGETPEQALIRGIREDLKLEHIGPIRKIRDEPFTINLESRSYPGLTTMKNGVTFGAIIDKDGYRVDGYEHRNPDGSLIRYEWRPVPIESICPSLLETADTPRKSMLRPAEQLCPCTV